VSLGDRPNGLQVGILGLQRILVHRSHRERAHTQGTERRVWGAEVPLPPPPPPPVGSVNQDPLKTEDPNL
jgi:hypothetical protein